MILFLSRYSCFFQKLKYVADHDECHVPRQQPCVLLVVRCDPRSCHPHKEGDEEEAQEHDGGEEELTLVHGVQAHLD